MCAYYEGDVSTSPADKGTMLRFVEAAPAPMPLPGFVSVDASFDGTSLPAYCDHWVSNVISRTGFLSTLEDTLGFTPKVDFNAGVVAAGEAQIESTVTGNNAPPLSNSGDFGLSDQSQVYLPINNALSPVGHVHGFIKEIGQGVQHVASRVGDLITLIQRANDYRKVTGEGLSFLGIPRSYYGVLSEQLLHTTLAGEPLLDAVAAAECFQHCEQAGICTVAAGETDLDLTRDTLRAKLEGWSAGKDVGVVDAVVEVIMRSRYVNLYGLLREHMSEASYVHIVKNKVRVGRARPELGRRL